MLTEERPGVCGPTMTLPFDSDRLHRLFGMIAKGLLWHHWGVVVRDDHDLRVLSLTAFGEAIFRNLLGWRASRRVRGDLGSGAFIYEGAQGADDPEFSVWRISIYGGLKLTGDQTAPTEEISGVGVVSARRAFLERPDMMETFG